MSRMLVLIISIACGILFIALMTLIFGDSKVGIILLDSQSTIFYYPFTIQNLCYLLFFIGLGDAFLCWRLARSEYAIINERLLPEDYETVLQTHDLPQIRLKTLGRYGEDRGFAPMLIDLCILRFQASKSVEQTLAILNNTLELLAHRTDLRYQGIRYIVWVIPTIGFIGTVVGISYTLVVVDPSNLNLKAITERLALAFNTTLVALILSGIMMLFLNRTQAFEEKVLNRAGEYVLKNLINRLYA